MIPKYWLIIAHFGNAILCRIRNIIYRNSEVILFYSKRSLNAGINQDVVIQRNLIKSAKSKKTAEKSDSLPIHVNAY